MDAPATDSGSEQRNVVLAISADGKQALDAAAASHGMTLKELLSRLVRYFLAMDKSERAIMVGQVNPEDESSFARLIVRRQSREAAAARGAARRAVRAPRPARKAGA